MGSLGGRSDPILCLYFSLVRGKMPRMHKISCIIPAYNERVRIGRILEVVTTHPHISEVIVIDDRSTDGTGEVVKRFKDVMLLTQPVNQGKSMAIYDGIRASTGDILLF